MSMLMFVTKRITAVAIFFFLLVTTVFVVFRVLPEDPAAMDMIAPRGASPEIIEAMQEQMGLNKPLPYQYLIYLRNTVSGEFGVSFYFERDVTDIVMTRLFPTTVLTGTALFLAVIIDFLAEGALAKKAALVNILFYLIPFLFLGLLLIFLFSYKLDLFPVGGMKSPVIWSPALHAPAAAKLTDILYHLILPLSVLVIWISVGFLPFVKTTSQGEIQEKKALILPGLTTVLAAFALFYGAMVTETTFRWPGIHSAFVEASLNYDYPLAWGALILGALFSLVLAFVMEIFYAGIASFRTRTTPP